MKLFYGKLGIDVRAMMIFLRKLITFSVLFFIFAFCGQKQSVSYEQECGIEQSPYQLAEAYFDKEDTVMLALRFVRFTPKEEGTLLDSSRIFRAMDTLNQKFSPARIQFALVEMIDRIDTDAYFHIEDYRYHVLEFKKESRMRYKIPAIDIFIYPPSPEFYPGVALGIPSDAFIIQNHLLYSSTLIHELGHVLGLHHTHAGAGNGYDKGDFICDLPEVDPWTNLVDANCAYKGPLKLSEEEIQKVIKNYMSYSLQVCRNSFTQDQIDRMRNTIEKYPILVEKIIL